MSNFVLDEEKHLCSTCDWQGTLKEAKEATFLGHFYNWKCPKCGTQLF